MSSISGFEFLRPFCLNIVVFRKVFSVINRVVNYLNSTSSKLKFQVCLAKHFLSIFIIL